MDKVLLDTSVSFSYQYSCSCTCYMYMYMYLAWGVISRVTSDNVNDQRQRES